MPRPRAGSCATAPPPPFQLPLHGFPQRPADDRLMVVPQDDLFLLPVVVFLCMGKVVRRDALFLYQVPHIFFISEDLDDMAARPRRAAPTGAAACRLQAARDFAGTFFLLPVLSENPPDNRRPFGVQP